MVIDMRHNIIHVHVLKHQELGLTWSLSQVKTKQSAYDVLNYSNMSDKSVELSVASNRDNFL